MAVLGLTFASCRLIMVAAHTIPLGRLFPGLMVEPPLDRLSRGDVEVVIVLPIAAGMVTLVGGGDGIRILTLAAPDVAIWITTLEVSVYVDIAVALAAAAANLWFAECARGCTGWLCAGLASGRTGVPCGRASRGRPSPAMTTRIRA